MNILHDFKALAACAFAVLVAAGCSKEQTSMDINDIQGKAKIIGSLSYSEGQSYANGEYSETILPAAQKKVFVKVSNASLSPNGQAEGYTTYETVTDENGKFEIEIPAVEKTNGTTVLVQPETFTGTRTLLTTVENNQPKFEEKEVVYSIAQKTLTIYPNETKVEDMAYGFTERDIEEGFPVTVPLTIRVGLGISERSETPSYGSYYELAGTFNYQSGNAVMITVTYDGITENNTTMTRNYAATTDANGEVEFNIPAKAIQWNNVSINIKAMPFMSENFVYYDNENTRNVIDSGIYHQYVNNTTNDNGENVTVNFSGIEGVTSYREVRMVFVPIAGVETYGYSYSDYSWDTISFE